MGRKELRFQSHIIDSYKNWNGYGRKWSSEWTVGVPDLVLSLPLFGGHLAEVKHRPTWDFGKIYKNPLTDKQQEDCEAYHEAQCNVLGMVIIGSDKALGSGLALFHPVPDEIVLDPRFYVGYSQEGIGTKFNIPRLLKAWEAENGWYR